MFTGEIPNRIIYNNCAILTRHPLDAYEICSSHPNALFGPIRPGDWYNENHKLTETDLRSNPENWKPCPLPENLIALDKGMAEEMVDWILSNLDVRNPNPKGTNYCCLFCHQGNSYDAKDHTFTGDIQHKDDCCGKAFLLALRGY